MARFGSSSANFGRIRPNSGRVSHMLARSGRFRPTLVDFDRSWADLDRSCAEFDQLCPSSAEFGPNWAEFGNHAPVRSTPAPEARLRRCYAGVAELYSLKAQGLGGPMLCADLAFPQLRHGVRARRRSPRRQCSCPSHAFSILGAPRSILSSSRVVQTRCPIVCSVKFCGPTLAELRAMGQGRARSSASLSATPWNSPSGSGPSRGSPARIASTTMFKSHGRPLCHRTQGEGPPMWTSRPRLRKNMSVSLPSASRRIGRSARRWRALAVARGSAPAHRTSGLELSPFLPCSALPSSPPRPKHCVARSRPQALPL